MRYKIFLYLLLGMGSLTAMESPIKRRCLEGHERRMSITRQPLKLFDRTLLFIIAYYKYKSIAQVQAKIEILPLDLQEKIGANLTALRDYNSKKYKRLPIG